MCSRNVICQPSNANRECKGLSCCRVWEATVTTLTYEVFLNPSEWCMIDSGSRSAVSGPESSGPALCPLWHLPPRSGSLTHTTVYCLGTKDATVLVTPLDCQVSSGKTQREDTTAATKARQNHKNSVAVYCLPLGVFLQGISPRLRQIQV